MGAQQDFGSQGRASGDDFGDKVVTALINFGLQVGQGVGTERLPVRAICLVRAELNRRNNHTGLFIEAGPVFMNDNRPDRPNQADARCRDAVALRHNPEPGAARHVAIHVDRLAASRGAIIADEFRQVGKATSDNAAR